MTRAARAPWYPEPGAGAATGDAWRPSCRGRSAARAGGALQDVLLQRGFAARLHQKEPAADSVGRAARARMGASAIPPGGRDACRNRNAGERPRWHVRARGRRSQPPARAFPPHGRRSSDPARLYGACAAMRRLFTAIERVAPTSATVMILGESGTGKELVARDDPRAVAGAARSRSSRSTAARPARTLIESELFGHEQRQLHRRRRARTAAASSAPTAARCSSTRSPRCRSTLQVQAAARARDRPLHARRRRPARSRPTCASSRPPTATSRTAVARGQLREDLLYRLNVFPIELPPLRERGERHRAAGRALPGRAQRATRQPPSASPPAARERIAAYRWPGNVRELRNVVQRAFVLCGDRCRCRARAAGAAAARRWCGLPRGEPAPRERTVAVRVGTSLAEAERALILATLDAVGGSRRRPRSCWASASRRCTTGCRRIAAPAPRAPPRRRGATAAGSRSSPERGPWPARRRSGASGFARRRSRRLQCGGIRRVRRTPREVQ